MNGKFWELFILIPIGFILASCALIVFQRTQLPDALKGILFGLSIGIMLMPFIVRRFKQVNP